MAPLTFKLLSFVFAYECELYSTTSMLESYA